MKKLRGALEAIVILLLCLATSAGTATLINLATQVKGILSAANGGTGAAITPPSSNGDYSCGFHVTGGVAVPMNCSLSGLIARAVTGTTFTDLIAFSDNNEPIEYQGSAAVAVSLPTPTTLGNPHFWTLLNNLTTGSSTLVTVTPAGGWTINGSATLQIVQNQECSIQVNPSVGTDWLSVCSGNGVGGAVGSVFGRVGPVSANTGDYTCAQVTGCGTAVPINPITATLRAAGWEWMGQQTNTPPTADNYAANGGSGTACGTSTVPPCIAQWNGDSYHSSAAWKVGQNISFSESGQVTSLSGGTPISCVFVEVVIGGTLDEDCGPGEGAVQDIAAFRWSVPDGDTNWKCLTAAAVGVYTSTDSGVAVDTAAHVFQITFNDAVPNVVFKIDGVTVCTATTNLPRTNTVMGHGFFVGGGDGTHNFREFAYYIQSGNSW